MAKPPEGEPQNRLQRERPLSHSPLIFNPDDPKIPLTPEERSRTRQVLDLMRVQIPDVVAYSDPRTGLGAREEVTEGDDFCINLFCSQSLSFFTNLFDSSAVIKIF